MNRDDEQRGLMMDSNRSQQEHLHRGKGSFAARVRPVSNFASTRTGLLYAMLQYVISLIRHRIIKYK
jgi:hypothetical protein